MSAPADLGLPWFATAPPPPQWPGVTLPCTSDPDAWFPASGGPPTGEVERACAACPVQAECLAWATQAGPSHGVWGGVSAAEIGRRRAGEPARIRKVPVPRVRRPARRPGCGHPDTDIRVAGDRLKCVTCEARYRRDRKERDDADRAAGRLPGQRRRGSAA